MIVNEILYQALIKSLPRLITRLFTTLPPSKTIMLTRLFTIRSLEIYHRLYPVYLQQHKDGRAPLFKGRGR